ncbi:MAG: T9SS type A sorting domain-containing protein [Calditrichaeota bacterium]|nr:T9SS type A sorting domain-containing protein [Calditrichota bacterium]HQU74389.1 FlgD immunoglobulin-like domain containing protein [Calditrichia bacterium]
MKFNIIRLRLLLPLLLSWVVLPALSQVRLDWEAIYTSDNPTSFDRGEAITADRNGNIVAIANTGENGNTNFSLLRFLPDGTRDWIRRIQHSFFQEARLGVADQNGNIAVAGITLDNTATLNLVIAKSDPAGQQLWTREFNTGFGISEEPWGMAIGLRSRIHVVGDVAGAIGSSPNLFTITYSTNGDSLWYLPYIAPDSLFTRRATMTVAEDGTLCMATGLLDNQFRFWGSVYVQADTAGRQLAETIVPGHWIDTGNRILSYGKNGHLFSAGWDLSGFKVVEIDRGGTVVRNYFSALPDSAFNPQAWAVLLTSLDHPVLLGSVNHSLTRRAEQVVVKFLPDGQIDWQWRGAVDSLGLSEGRVFGGINRANDIFLAGGGWEAGVVKLDEQGRERWHIRQTPPSLNEAYEVRGMVLVGENSPVLTGNARNPVTNFDVFVLKFSEDPTGLPTLSGNLPGSFTLSAPYPNPFNPETGFAITLPGRAATIAVKVYDLHGRLVNTLFEGSLNAGSHRFTWSGADQDGRAVASGIYFIRAQSQNTARTRRAVLIK